MQVFKKHPLTLVFLLSVLPLIPLLFGQFYAVGDMRDVFIPLESFFHNQQLQGNIPAWDPSVSFGFPVIASAQIGFFYPVLFVLRFLPVWLELPLVLVLHTVFCAIGSFLFARRLGLSKEASLFAALSFSFSQFIWQHLTHLNIFLAVAWLPWQMLAVDILFKRERIGRRGMVTLITLFGIPFLIGQIQTPFLIMVTALLYGCWIQPKTISWKQVSVTLLLIGVGTFLLSSVQLLPTLELASLSSRGTPGGFDIMRANQHSYPLYHLPTYLFPRFYGNDDTYWGKRLEIEYGTYIGVIPFLFALWFFIASFRIREKGSSLVFFRWAMVISFLLALGSLSPFRLIGLEPSLWIFSAPARWLLVTTFSLSIFAGFGFDAVFTNTAGIKRILKFIIPLVVGIIIIGNVALYLLPGTITHPKIVSMIASAKGSSISLLSPYTYIPLILLLLLPYLLSHANAKKIILALTVVDLSLIAATTTPTSSWEDILATPTSIQDLPQEIKNNQARIYSLRDGGDTGAYFTDPSSRANDATRELQKNLLVPMVSSQFGIFGIEWPASLDLSEQGAVLERLHPTQPYAVEDTTLAQELTIGAVLSPASNGGIGVQALESKQRIEITDGTLEVLSDRPSELIIKTKTEADATLIVRDTFYPGWRAYVDGQEVAIEKSPLFFRSIAIPSGDHEVVMKYVPETLIIGGIISLVTCMVCIIFVKKKSATKVS